MCHVDIPQLGSPTLVLFFSCPEQIALDRFLTRRLAGRETDDHAMFTKRFQEFEKLNPEIVEHYRAQGILLEVVLAHCLSRLHSDIEADRYQWRDRDIVSKTHEYLEGCRRMENVSRSIISCSVSVAVRSSPRVGRKEHSCFESCARCEITQDLHNRSTSSRLFW